MQELECLVSDKKPDIIAITESWCNGNTSPVLLNISGYSLEIRQDRTDTKDGIGGGILVFVRNGLTIFNVDMKKFNFNQYCKFSILSDNGEGNLNITIVYRSPNSSDLNNSELCKILREHDKNCIIIGDFNFPGINWTNQSSVKKSQEFLDETIFAGLHQIVDFPTHIKGNILDLVITDNPDNIVNITDLGRLGKSDHSMLSIIYDFRPRLSKSVEKVYNWKNADFHSIIYEMSLIPWQNISEGLNTEESWKFFKDNLNALTEKYVPKKLRRQNFKPIWMKPNVMRLIRKKQRLYNHYKTTKEHKSFLEYKEIEKSVKNAVRNAKKNFEKQLAKKSRRHNKSFYSYVQNKTKIKSNVGPLLKQDGEITSDDIEMTEILNTYFSSVFSAEGDGPIPTLSRLPSEETLSTTFFDESDIIEKIDKMKPTTSPGTDGITSTILKELKNIICKPLAIVFNKSLKEGYVPEDWRLANVTPIFKKGVKCKPENYRPISLTSLVCKTMESILRDKIVDHLQKNNLINPSQHGFMKQKSCLTNLLEFLEVITSLQDEGHSMDIIFLDFSKAFDKVPKNRLLEKLKAHSINGDILRWIEAWLTNRGQRVVLNGQYSEWKPVLSGVPQGSVLGPILFIIYINDIDFLCAHISVLKKFADDTKLAQKMLNESDKNILQNCLNKLCDWAETWGMMFNVDKCKVMHIGNRNPCYTYTMNNQTLSEIDEEKDIGVTMHANLKPSVHCNQSAQKANGILSLISKAFHYRDKVTFINLYKLYVRPHLEFSVPAWCPWSVGDKETIEKVQKRAVSMVSGLTGSSYSEKLIELNLQSLENRRLRYDLIETYKIIHGVNNVNKCTWFSMLADTSNRITRMSENPLSLSAKLCKTDIRKHFFSQRVVSPWNDLPCDIKTAPTLNTFKSRYDEYVKNF